MLKEAGVQEGDVVAVGLSGSFPALNICTYAACDVLVLPSVNFTETFGLVQVEAMLCGTPVVASDLPGVREAIRVTGMGRIAPPRKPECLTDAIIDVISNRSRYVRPRDEIAARFRIDATVDAYERVYRGEAVT